MVMCVSLLMSYCVRMLSYHGRSSIFQAEAVTHADHCARCSVCTVNVSSNLIFEESDKVTLPFSCMMRIFNVQRQYQYTTDLWWFQRHSLHLFCVLVFACVTQPHSNSSSLAAAISLANNIDTHIRNNNNHQQPSTNNNIVHTDNDEIKSNYSQWTT